MEEQTCRIVRNSLIDGGPLAYAVVQLKLHDYPATLRHYLAAPLPLLSPQLTPLPAWLRSLVYVDRFDLVVEEQRLGDIGPGAAPADALLYLLSAPPDSLSQWNSLRGPAAFATLSRQGNWLLAGERQQLLQLSGCRPVEPKGGQWHSLQLLQIMLRQWLLRQAYADLLARPAGFEEILPFRDSFEERVVPDFLPGLALRNAARRRFPILNQRSFERRDDHAATTCATAAAPAAETPA